MTVDFCLQFCRSWYEMKVDTVTSWLQLCSLWLKMTSLGQVGGTWDFYEVKKFYEQKSFLKNNMLEHVFNMGDIK